jgi:NAD(P)-dependent dehydrogenase (short-subunit alcohol dehydrogenase family)
MAQVWLVTGSSRGLGRAIVEAGLAAGNKVLATRGLAGDSDTLR